MLIEVRDRAQSRQAAQRKADAEAKAAHERSLVDRPGPFYNEGNVNFLVMNLNLYRTRLC